MNELSHVKSELTDRPLIICDVDEVILEFLTPLQNFLQNSGYELHANSFALNGNIRNIEKDKFVSDHRVSELIESFYKEQNSWQTLVSGARTSLKILHTQFDVVLLTAMSPEHYATRVELLNAFGIPYPLIASEKSKGPAIRELISGTTKPSFFIDDMIYNHKSVMSHSPNTSCIYFMANEQFSQIAPARPDHVSDARNWSEIRDLILLKSP